MPTPSHSTPQNAPPIRLSRGDISALTSSVNASLLQCAALLAKAPGSTSSASQALGRADAAFALATTFRRPELAAKAQLFRARSLRAQGRWREAHAAFVRAASVREFAADGGEEGLERVTAECARRARDEEGRRRRGRRSEKAGGACGKGILRTTAVGGKVVERARVLRPGVRRVSISEPTAATGGQRRVRFVDLEDEDNIYDKMGEIDWEAFGNDPEEMEDHHGVATMPTAPPGFLRYVRDENGRLVLQSGVSPGLRSVKGMSSDSLRSLL